jgi:tRNA(Ile)-lysidine synthase
MSTAPSHLIDVVRDSSLLDEGDRVLVAVSGGGDSMALLDVLRSLRRDVDVVAAHFDHRLRDDSHRDREIVERYCDGHRIECRAGGADVAEWSRENRMSLEAGARKLRYRFLDEAADDAGADKIATAHTRDDNVETVLMRVLRGSGIRGLAGIPKRRGRIVRPFLEVSRDGTADYCRTFSVPFTEDPSNRDTRFERNYVRHELLPSLRAADPDTDAGVDASLEALHRGASEAVAAIRRVTDAIVTEHLTREPGGVWVLPIGPVSPLDSLSRYVLFADVLSHHLGCEAEPGRVHFEALSALIDRAPGAGTRTSLPGIDARREHDDLVFFDGARDNTPRRFRPGILAVPGVTRMAGLRVAADVVAREDVGTHPRARASGIPESGGGIASAAAYFSLDSIEPPLVMRSPRAGDRMHPFGMSGTKKLSDIFIDKKIPHRRRGNLVVVEDRREIVWVVGVATSESTRVTDRSRDIVEVIVTGDAG